MFEVTAYPGMFRARSSGKAGGAAISRVAVKSNEIGTVINEVPVTFKVNDTPYIIGIEVSIGGEQTRHSTHDCPLEYLGWAGDRDMVRLNLADFFRYITEGNTAKLD